MREGSEGTSKVTNECSDSMRPRPELSPISAGTGVAVGGIAHEREQVGDERRINAKLSADSGCIANCFAPAIDLDHARIPHALRRILVRRPDGDFLHVLVPGREMGG